MATQTLEILQESPHLEKKVTQDVKWTMTLDGAKSSTDTTAWSATAVNAAGTTVSLGTITSSTAGEFTAQVAGSAISTETTLTVTLAVTVSGAQSTFVREYPVLGSQIFSLYEFRNAGAGKFTSAKFSDDTVKRHRALVTDFFEDYCNRHFVRRYKEITVDGNGKTRLSVPVNDLQSVQSITMDGTALTTTQLADVKVYEWGELYYESGWNFDERNVTIGYIAGGGVPYDIKRSAIEYTKWLVSPGNTTDRAMILTDENGTYRLSQASMNRPTGFPSIDHALNLYRQVGIW